MKIDRSYTERAVSGDRCRRLITGFVRVFDDLGLTVVAEGIETDLQRRLMQDLGCRVGQGYLFGRPTSLEALEELLQSASARAERCSGLLSDAR